MARALGALESHGSKETVRVLGLLLFGREDVLASALPTHEVAVQEISGTDVLVNDFSADRCSGCWKIYRLVFGRGTVSARCWSV